MKFSKEEKEMWLKDWKKSGKSVWGYAKENGISPHTFRDWVKSKAKKASGFVEIPARKILKRELSQEIMVEKGDLKIHIPLSVWIEYPGTIMEGLKVAL